MDAIRSQFLDVERSGRFEMDSVVVRAWASPEGTQEGNRSLSQRRAAAVADHFRRFIRHYRDSAAHSAFYVNVQENGAETVESPSARKQPDIRFFWRGEGENWALLDGLVRSDTLLSPAAKEAYGSLSGLPVHERKLALRKAAFYPHLRKDLYPRLRVVTFDLHFSRKGMVKDTVHTTEPDTLYSRAVQYLRERDYPAALELLRPYKDYNTALAYLAMDYNASARQILEGLERTPRVNYLLALLLFALAQVLFAQVDDSAGFFLNRNLIQHKSGIIIRQHRHLVPDRRVSRLPPVRNSITVPVII